ncbi:MAG: 2-hydroxyacyl-CoA dehydratase family protein [Streptosporangiaceae bacterium]|jgi:benzoyl-CoA reductase/2-hydroxyglutaryl-CoA dehydratase subunit BcrC/BadD/HgdB
MPDATAPLAQLAEAARDPRGYIERWRSVHPGQPVVGVLPMNFPREIAYAAGTLPVVVQDDKQPVTEGRSLLAEFYCGYTRNLADQAATGRFTGYDALFLADHCIQLIGAADVMRAVLPDIPVFFGMLISSMSDTWAPGKTAEMMGEFRAEFGSFTGRPVGDDALAASIAAHNRDRQLIRGLFDERSSGHAAFSPGQLQDIVGSAMVMDPVEHYELLAGAVRAARAVPRDDRVRVHLSAHLCHAPKRELLDLIEDSGVIVVDDDLFHGRRYVSTDVDETGDPIEAIARWYAQRNVNIPCPTRVQSDVDWDAYLVSAVRRSGAEAVIHLLPKFCEPHMLYYPELRKGLDAAGIPQLLLETEHEGLPAESVRTRVEALVERVRRKRPVSA